MIADAELSSLSYMDVQLLLFPAIILLDLVNKLRTFEDFTDFDDFVDLYKLIFRGSIWLRFEDEPFREVTNLVPGFFQSAYLPFIGP